MKTGDTPSRIELLTELLQSGRLSTQEELAEALGQQGFKVTQSTISRDLRRISATKSVDATGRTIYRLTSANGPAPVLSSNLEGLILDMNHNGAMIVINTSPGSASLVARHLDTLKSQGILGTLAGDDTIFVAPTSIKDIDQLMERLSELTSDL